MGGNDADPTAHFWAIDGIGALGLPGVLLISAFCGLVFWTLDSAARKHDPRLAALVTCYAAYNIATFRFHEFVLRGLAILILALYLMPAETVSPWKEPERGASREAKKAARGGRCRYGMMMDCKIRRGSRSAVRHPREELWQGAQIKCQRMKLGKEGACWCVLPQGLAGKQRRLFVWRGRGHFV